MADLLTIESVRIVWPGPMIAEEAHDTYSRAPKEPLEIHPKETSSFHWLFLPFYSQNHT